MHCFVLLLLLALADLSLELDVMLDGIQECDGSGDSGVNLKNLDIEPISETEMLLSFDVIVNVPLPDGIKFRLTFMRCRSKEAEDTCQHMSDYTETEFCSHINDTNKIWYTSVQSIKDFKAKCPIGKGTHKVTNAYLNAEGAKRYPVLNGYWKVWVIGKDGNNNKYSCFIISAVIQNFHRLK